MSIIDDYIRIANVSAGQTNIKPFIPHPTDNDYKVGEIQRYFIQQSNQKSGEIFEISKQSFADFQLSPLYVTVSLRWKISGPAESTRSNIHGTMVRERSGVLEANQAEIVRARTKIPQISQKLLNPFQYWRGW